VFHDDFPFSELLGTDGDIGFRLKSPSILPPLERRKTCNVFFEYRTKVGDFLPTFPLAMGDNPAAENGGRSSASPSAPPLRGHGVSRLPGFAVAILPGFMVDTLP